MVLVGNKLDLAEERQVSTEEAALYAEGCAIHLRLCICRSPKGSVMQRCVCRTCTTVSTMSAHRD